MQQGSAIRVIIQTILLTSILPPFPIHNDVCDWRYDAGAATGWPFAAGSLVTGACSVDFTFFPLPGGGGWYTFSCKRSLVHSHICFDEAHLFLLLFWLSIGIGISQLLDLLPFFILLEALSDGI